MRILLLTVVLHLGLCVSTQAQQLNKPHPKPNFVLKHSTRVGQTLWSDLKHIAKKSPQTLTQPLRWESSDWWLTSAVVGSSILLYQQKSNDYQLFVFDRLNQKKGSQIKPKTFFEKSYETLFDVHISNIALGVGGVYLASNLLNVKPVRIASLQMMQSSMVSGLLAVLGSYIFSEQRPGGGGEMSYFEPKGHGISGHSAYFASLSGPLNAQFSKLKKEDTPVQRAGKYALKSVFYGVPLLVGYSRLRHKFSYNYDSGKPEPSHYAWNVLLGLSLGYAVGEYFASQEVSLKPTQKAIP